jgi:type II secretory pathway pseudopilin PulG
MRLRARQGFGLLELVIAIALMSFVMGGIMQGIMGMRKTQGMSVSQNLLKVAGQSAIRNIYMELSQSRKLLASTSLEPITKDTGREYFMIMQGASTSPPAIPTGNMQFPRVDANGAFGLPGANSGELEQSTVGNTLVFATTVTNLKIDIPTYTYLVGVLPKFFSNQPYYIPALKFVAYYLIEKPLPAGVAKLPGNRAVTQQLVRWESKPYIEKGELAGLASKCVGAPVTTKAIWDWLQAHPDPNYHVAGLWDASAATASTSLFTVDGGGNIVAQPAGSLLQKRRQTMIAQTELDPYAIGMVAYNTGVNFPLKDNDQIIPVPAYALTDTTHANFPYGFEVAIVGPSGARSVLVRLTLCARVNTGLHLYGSVQQEVIKVFDM